MSETDELILGRSASNSESEESDNDDRRVGDIVNDEDERRRANEAEPPHLREPIKPRADRKKKKKKGKKRSDADTDDSIVDQDDFPSNHSSDDSDVYDRKQRGSDADTDDSKVDQDESDTNDPKQKEEAAQAAGLQKALAEAGVVDPDENEEVAAQMAAIRAMYPHPGKFAIPSPPLPPSRRATKREKRDEDKQATVQIEKAKTKSTGEVGIAFPNSVSIELIKNVPGVQPPMPLLWGLLGYTEQTLIHSGRQARENWLLLGKMLVILGAWTGLNLIPIAEQHPLKMKRLEKDKIYLQLCSIILGRPINIWRFTQKDTNLFAGEIKGTFLGKHVEVADGKSMWTFTGELTTGKLSFEGSCRNVKTKIDDGTNNPRSVRLPISFDSFTGKFETDTEQEAARDTKKSKKSKNASSAKKNMVINFKGIATVSDTSVTFTANFTNNAAGTFKGHFERGTHKFTITGDFFVHFDWGLEGIKSDKSDDASSHRLPIHKINYSNKPGNVSDAINIVFMSPRSSGDHDDEFSYGVFKNRIQDTSSSLKMRRSDIHESSDYGVVTMLFQQLLCYLYPENYQRRTANDPAPNEHQERLSNVCLRVLYHVFWHREEIPQTSNRKDPNADFSILYMRLHDFWVKPDWIGLRRLFQKTIYPLKKSEGEKHAVFMILLSFCFVRKIDVPPALTAPINIFMDDLKDLWDRDLYPTWSWGGTSVQNLPLDDFDSILPVPASKHSLSVPNPYPVRSDHIDIFFGLSIDKYIDRLRLVVPLAYHNISLRALFADQYPSVLLEIWHSNEFVVDDNEAQNVDLDTTVAILKKTDENAHITIRPTTFLLYCESNNKLYKIKIFNDSDTIAKCLRAPVNEVPEYVQKEVRNSRMWASLLRGSRAHYTVPNNTLAREIRGLKLTYKKVSGAAPTPSATESDPYNPNYPKPSYSSVEYDPSDGGKKDVNPARAKVVPEQKGRLTVGDWVKIIKGSGTGQTGEIIQDDHSHKPYKIKGIGWCAESDVEHWSPPVISNAAASAY